MRKEDLLREIEIFEGVANTVIGKLDKAWLTY